MRSLLEVVCVAALLLVPCAASGSGIIYTVNKAWPVDGNDTILTGTIETDGTLGTITVANIVAFNLSLYMSQYDWPVTFSIAYPWPAGGAYFAEVGPYSILSATATELYVDFNEQIASEVAGFEIKQGFADPWGGWA